MTGLRKCQSGPAKYYQHVAFARLCRCGFGGPCGIASKGQTGELVVQVGIHDVGLANFTNASSNSTRQRLLSILIDEWMIRNASHNIFCQGFDFLPLALSGLNIQCHVVDFFNANDYHSHTTFLTIASPSCAYYPPCCY
jgi:hypothetical protein